MQMGTHDGYFHLKQLPKDRCKSEHNVETAWKWMKGLLSDCGTDEMHCMDNRMVLDTLVLLLSDLFSSLQLYMEQTKRVFLAFVIVSHSK